jgi:hypothetical protein
MRPPYHYFIHGRECQKPDYEEREVGRATWSIMGRLLAVWAGLIGFALVAGW